MNDKCPKVIQQMFSYFVCISLSLIQFKKTLLISGLETRFSVVTFTVVFAYSHKVQQYFLLIVAVTIKLFSEAFIFVISSC